MGAPPAVRPPPQVKQNEAHRMLFQCESGRHRGNIRIRSRATNTFLFFLGVKQPLTWVVSKLSFFFFCPLSFFSFSFLGVA